MTKLISTAQLLQSTINFKEISLCQYRQLLKCLLGDEVLTDLIFNNTDNILKQITTLTQNEINNLSFLDYSILLFNIRQTSIGDSVYLYIEENNKQVKIDLRISNILKQIFNTNLKQLLNSEVIDNCKIEYRIPSINEIITLEKEKDTYSLYTFFLKTIKVSNTVIDLETFSYKERENIAQKIPVKVMTALTKRTHSIIETCNRINVLESVKSDIFNKELQLTLNSQLLAYIIKILFNTNLESVYEYMFALSKMANFSCTFLDECSPGEFYFFTKKLEEVTTKQQQQEQQLQNSSDSLPPINSDFNLE